MAFCPQCGSPVSGNFCGSCGRPLETPAHPAPPPPGPSPSQPAGDMANNLASTLAYLPAAGLLISILFLAVAPYNQRKPVRFDAWQSILLHAAWFLVVLVVETLFTWYWAYRLVRLLHLAWVLLLVFLMWKAYQQQKVVLPVVGQIAEKQA